jgi:pimeloyl-ACP methyl ester carboxylesterase
MLGGAIAPPPGSRQAAAREVLRGVQLSDIVTSAPYQLGGTGPTGGTVVTGAVASYFSDGITPIRLRAKANYLLHSQASKVMLAAIYDTVTNTEIDRVTVNATSAVNTGAPINLETEPFVPAAGWHTYALQIANLGTATVASATLQADEKYPCSLVVEELAFRAGAPAAVKTRYGTGKITSGESHSALLRQDYKADGTVEGVLVGHGRGGSAITHLDGNAGYLAWALARAGYPTLCPDLGGTAPWGNDLEITRAGLSKTYLQGTRLNAKAGKIILYGGSMGGLGLLNWARQNAGSIDAILLVDPVLDLGAVHDGNVGGFAAEIETAYTNLAGLTTALPTHSPVVHGAALAGLKIHIWHATDDAFCTPAHVAAFKALVGSTCTSTSLGAVGHTSTGLTGDAFVAKLAQLLA